MEYSFTSDTPLSRLFSTPGPNSFSILDSDPELWYACAGPLVQIPPPNSLVYYFVQGHLEHCCIEDLDMAALGFQGNPPSRILCRVVSVNYLADPATDQVFAKFMLTPIRNHEPIVLDASLYPNPRPVDQIKRYPEDTVRKYSLENTKLRPQTIEYTNRYDLHSRMWQFQCIQIRRGVYVDHIGISWNALLSEKRVVEGDTIMLMKDRRGIERYGILRGKRRTYDNCYDLNKDSVFKAVQAKFKKPFEVYYYPRFDTPEFVVNAARVEAAMQIPWEVGMKVTMQYEDERTSLPQMCIATISSVEDADHKNWRNSQWRRIQIIMDHPHLNLNDVLVNPWMLDTESADGSMKKDIEEFLELIRYVKRSF